ncbi:coiled-coil domain-containing protein 114-like, partial [Parambassis ranga]
MEQAEAKGRQQEQDYDSRLRDVQERLKEAESQAEDYEDQATIISKVLEQIKTGVNSTFSSLECDRSLIDDMVGSSTSVTDNNIMSYLGL